jgi:DNA polymerase-1
MRAIYHGPNKDLSLDELINKLLYPPTTMIAVDTETVSTTNKTCIGIGIAINPNEAFYVPIWPEPSEVLQQVYSLLTRQDLYKVGHNYNFDIETLREFGNSMDYNPIDVWSIHDTATLANVMGLPGGLHELGNSILNNYDLFTIPEVLQRAKESTGKKSVTMLDADQELVALKCCNDVRTTYGLFEKLIGTISPAQFDCYEVDRHLLGILKTIELTGLKLNEEELNKQYSHLMASCEVYEDWADEQGFNINSPAQVGMYLATNGVHGIPYTKSGKQYDTSIEVLEKINHPLAKQVLEHRKRKKLLSTYIEPYMGLDRGYTHFRLDLSTGRLASYDRNFQNIPPDMRRIFSPDYGVFTWFDMSQLEMRVFAFLTQDKLLQQLYHEGKSVHNATFEAFYPDKPRYIEVEGKKQDSPYYVKAKTGNFAMIFNGNENTIATQCEITVPEAARFKNTWFNLHPEAYQWMQLMMNSNSQYAETIFGRRMRIPYDRGKGHAKTCLINYPTQGSGADINKRSLVKMWDMGYLNEVNFRLQVHDEIVLDGDYLDSFPHEAITRIHPDIEIPWEGKRDKVWL